MEHVLRIKRVLATLAAVTVVLLTASLASDQYGHPVDPAIDPAWNVVAPFTPPAESIPAVPGQLHITAAGDYGAGAAAGRVLAGIRSQDPDLNIALGDLSYGDPNAEQSWCNFVSAHTGQGFPFQLVAGNHESNGQNGHIDDFAACLPNRLPGLVGDYGRQYYVDVPERDPLVRIIAVSPGIPFPDGVWDYSEDSGRYKWTAAAIDGARANSIPWIVGVMHTPCLSVGRYACLPGKPLMDLMLSKKVDLVLSGHEHLYQRTMQLAHGVKCPGITPKVFVEECIKDGSNAMSKGAGTVFVTVGTGGKELRAVNKGDSEEPYFAAYSGTNASPSYGFLDLHMTDKALHGSFIPVDGTFTDSFAISR